MSTITTETRTPIPSNNMLQRDKEQAHLLHEPTHIYTSIDPITSRDIIVDRETHPRIEDGNVMFYFENEQTRKAYLDMQVNRPFPKLPGKPSAEDDRGGSRTGTDGYALANPSIVAARPSARPRRGDDGGLCSSTQLERATPVGGLSPQS